jgi:hypothetical protein
MLQRRQQHREHARAFVSMRCSSSMRLFCCPASTMCRSCSSCLSGRRLLSLGSGGRRSRLQSASFHAKCVQPYASSLGLGAHDHRRRGAAPAAALPSGLAGVKSTWLFHLPLRMARALFWLVVAAVAAGVCQGRRRGLHREQQPVVT